MFSFISAFRHLMGFIRANVSFYFILQHVFIYRSKNIVKLAKPLHLWALKNKLIKFYRRTRRVGGELFSFSLYFLFFFIFYLYLYYFSHTYTRTHTHAYMYVYIYIEYSLVHTYLYSCVTRISLINAAWAATYNRYWSHRLIIMKVRLILFLISFITYLNSLSSKPTSILNQLCDISIISDGRTKEPTDFFFKLTKIY